MRTHDYLIDDSVDFSRVDERTSLLIERSLPWLGGDDSHRVRLGLHELLVNIRRHAYRGEVGPISVSMTTSAGGLCVMVTDWGCGLPDLPDGATPRVSEVGGYGLAIIHRVFDEVDYRRAWGRNEWVLTVHAADLTRQ